ncbi:MAG TPA: peptidyl-alpha-hydroxyglycine alpha-amidating lyase family protein [Candidatus Acidoferrales bacterium]|nr:peptidyl-alpha-hydroxyglycine alpha-amidating lyase family protein [Candidatus Acidoferrales bacterium]
MTNKIISRAMQFVAVLAAFLFCIPVFAQSAIPEIPYDSAPNLLKMPDDIYLGEVLGVATNSKGHVFVYTRTGSVNVTTGTNRIFVRSASRLFEFDQNGKYVREIGQGLYGFIQAHAVRIDPQDNIWVVDEGSNMVIKFDQEGRVVMTMGRKPEAINNPVRPPNPEAGGGAGFPGDNFNGPSDVAWDSAGNIYVADGAVPSRVAKFDKNGVFIKTWGGRGSAPGQFNTPHSIVVDAKDNIYIADRGNNRIQVFDTDGNLKTQYANVGSPWALCITSGPHQYLYSSDSNTKDFGPATIYKMELDGTLLGKFGAGGKQLKEFGTIHEMDCRKDNELYVGEITNWRVQKLMLHPASGKSDATPSARK